MLAANNLHSTFDYLLPVITKRCPRQQLAEILNKQNSSNSTPLRKYIVNLDYAVVTDSKQMVKKLVEAGVNPQLKN